MRTTLNLDDAIVDSVKAYAEDRSLPLGKAASELLRRGLEVKRGTRLVNGVRVFDLPADSPPVSTRRVRELEPEAPPSPPRGHRRAR